MTVQSLDIRKIALVATLSAITAVFALLALSPSAEAQGLPAICDEYPELPQCDVEPQPPVDHPPGDHHDRGHGDFRDFGDGDGSADSGAKGELPFTGYPLTSLILLILALLVIGLTIRAYVAARQRMRPSGSDRAAP